MQSLVVNLQLLVEPAAFALYIVSFNAVALLIFFNALDDLYVDLVYLVRRLYRALVVLPHHEAACAYSMRALRKRQKAFAICVPAWDEKDVIAQMLERAVATLRYDNYRIFVGVYANDPGTRAAIERLFERNPDCRHRIRIVPHSAFGPTSKADCLNSIYRYVTQVDAWGIDADVAGFILHDAEDVMHPSELAVFNHLIERADVIQLPVMPLARPIYDLVGGHYLDEFAESHTKDLVVREALGAPLPSAGVGCAFSADALQGLAMLRGDAPFNERSVTEDYDVALDLTGMGFRSIFVRLPSRRGETSFVATQEFFPNTFTSAVRQKARWLLGIALDNWDSRGWRGNWAARYMLWRDRKALLTAFAAVAGYALLAVALIASATSQQSAAQLFAMVVPEGGVIWWLLLANLLFLINRVLQRFTFVYRSYGLLQALMSPLRIIVGNWINFFAALRAASLYRTARRKRGRKAWHKTRHQIPATDALLKLPGSR